MRIIKIEYNTSEAAIDAFKELAIICPKCRMFGCAVVVLETMHNVAKIKEIVKKSYADVIEPTTSDRWSLLNGG